MPIMNYTTTIAVSKTVGEVQATLARRGVSRISTLYNAEGNASGLGFEMLTDYGPREFELPVRTDAVLAALKRDLTPAKATKEQAARVAWRIAKDWLEAQAALIDAGMAQLDEVMLPYMLGDDRRPVYEVFRGTQLALEGGAR